MQSNANTSFFQKCSNLVEQRLKFSHFEGSIIPVSLEITLPLMSESIETIVSWKNFGFNSEGFTFYI